MFDDRLVEKDPNQARNISRLSSVSVGIGVEIVAIDPFRCALHKHGRVLR